MAHPMKSKLKVFISVDLEGIAGIVDEAETSPEGRDHPWARKLMTAEANAAMEGALEAGATEIIVNDSHWNKRNLIPEELNPAAQLIRGQQQPLSMMEGIDESFDAAIFIGYHGSLSSRRGVLDHIFDYNISHLIVNGIEYNEALLNAAVAGHVGVPVVFLSGDRAAVDETRKTLKDLPAVAVKEGLGRYAAKNLHPEKARELIRQGVKAALENRDKAQVFRVPAPVNIEVEFRYSQMATNAELIPGVQRTGTRTVSYQAKDFLEAFKVFKLMVILAEQR